MMRCDYPIDLRADYAEPRSRGWAILTILLIKLLAVLPHAIVLVILGIAQAVVVFVAQLVVAFTGEYPAGMFGFVVGVLRWQTRVNGFVYSLTDRYPPFTLQPDDSYPVDVVVERPASSSRVYAAFSVLVQVLVVVAVVWLIVWAIGNADTMSSTTTTYRSDSGTMWVQTDSSTSGSTSSWVQSVIQFNQSGGGLVLRSIAALPHLIVVGILGVVAAVIWLVVQWIILFTARYPRGMFDLVVNIVRWQTRVTGYTMGLIDRYPPFTFEASLVPATTPGAAAGPPAQWYPDPSGRHELRYWDGRQWTPHVSDGGQMLYDTDPGSAPRG